MKKEIKTTNKELIDLLKDVNLSPTQSNNALLNSIACLYLTAVNSSTPEYNKIMFQKFEQIHSFLCNKGYFS